MDGLLQEAINEMNRQDQHNRCSFCDFCKDDSCDMDDYLYCKNFTWHGLKPTEKGSEWEKK